MADPLEDFERHVNDFMLRWADAKARERPRIEAEAGEWIDGQLQYWGLQDPLKRKRLVRGKLRWFTNRLVEVRETTPVFEDLLRGVIGRRMRIPSPEQKERERLARQGALEVILRRSIGDPVLERMLAAVWKDLVDPRSPLARN